MAKEQEVVAVIDDDPGVRKSIARLLRAWGYLTETFASGREFLSAAAASSAKCLIVDVDLGDSSGLELVRQLSAKSLRFPVILISGSGDDTIRGQALDLGCIAYLRKPVLGVSLSEALDRATGSINRM